MSIAIVTGAGGLIGSQAVRHFSALGMHCVGIDNDMRGELFGRDGSVRDTLDRLRKVPSYIHRELDVRDRAGIDRLFGLYRDVSLVVHCAAQPAHDSADPLVDWDINATGTANVLEATRRYAPDAVFVHLSTIKVYGQQPNALPLVELGTRYDLHPATGYAHRDGIGEDMSIDGSAHSIFGASKTAADLMAQEYGHTLGLRTVILRPGCLTGAGHAAVEAHGFLGHLIRCVATGEAYRVHGDGKQVRDQIHAADVVNAIEQVWRDPPGPGAVFNLGGGRGTELSVLEALAMAEEITGHSAKVGHVPPRHGDHRWWVTDMAKFRTAYPTWRPAVDLRAIVAEIADRWQ